MLLVDMLVFRSSSDGAASRGHHRQECYRAHLLVPFSGALRRKETLIPRSLSRAIPIVRRGCVTPDDRVKGEEEWAVQSVLDSNSAYDIGVVLIRRRIDNTSEFLVEGKHRKVIAMDPADHGSGAGVPGAPHHLDLQA